MATHNYAKGEITNHVVCLECAKDWPVPLDPLWENCVDPGRTQADIKSKCCKCGYLGVNMPPELGLSSPGRPGKIK